MKINLFKIIITILILFIIFILLFIYSQIELKKNSTQKRIPVYHFVVLVGDKSSIFSNNILKGIDKAAEEKNVVVEVKRIKDNIGYDEVLKAFDMSILSMVDGIIINAFIPKEYLYKAINARIPVINIENNEAVGERIVNIGTNPYNVGFRIGDFLSKSQIKYPKIAIIISENEDIRYRNLLLSGIGNAIENKKIQIVTVRNAKNGILDAEGVVWDVLDKHPETNVIFCTSIDNTLGAIQTLKEIKKNTKEINIIGYDFSNEIVKYIENDTLLATVYADGYKIGYQSLNLLFDLKQRKKVNTNNEIEVEIISKENIKEYKNNSLEEVNDEK